MGKTTRKRYSAEFKAKVALEAVRGELTLSQLGAKYGVHQTLINAGKKQAVENLSAVFELPIALFWALTCGVTYLI